MKHAKMLSVLGLVACMTTALAVAAPQSGWGSKDKDMSEKVAKIGEKAPDFTLTSIDGKTHSLSDFKGKMVVIEWTNPGCPYVVGVYKNGIVSETLKKIKSMGDEAIYIAVNSTANMDKSAVMEQNRKFLEDHKVKVPVLIDYDGKVGKMYGAQRTPDMYVIDKDGVLRFVGGFTDDPRGKAGECTNQVLTAMKQIKSGETVSPDSPRRWGCTVKYAKR